METHYLKNIEFENVLELPSLVEYQQGQVVSRTFVQNKVVSITLFAFDEGEEISSHSSDGDAMLMILEGAARITIGNQEFSLNKGKTIVMPAGIPHAVAADGKFKMLLTVVFPQP
ncbi:cupin domain-containing protein [Caproicibacterium sp. BJN0003]|uniref:cupin domain-containing protein n=1 Tax=Caproicibacterium sp. BJN0003 TaxID=2994078 RepID=UPI00225480EB|nr:cupin domain-containing protein [Caproicibacterium sp. BJN0003]UZT82842.1 cupin domain-containing protein [Caproicibacterium sp. BJN0003]